MVPLLGARPTLTYPARSPQPWVRLALPVRAGSAQHLRGTRRDTDDARRSSCGSRPVMMGTVTGDLVFPAPKGGLRDPSNTSADHKDVFTAAGYDWMTSHALRRTVATLFDRAGLSTRVAADQLGHSKPSMTQDRYMNRDLHVTAGATVLEILADE